MKLPDRFMVAPFLLLLCAARPAEAQEDTQLWAEFKLRWIKTRQPRITDNGATYALGDAEWFWQLDDVKERFAGKQRLRGGIGYRRSSEWRFEGLLIWNRSRNTIDQPFSATDVVVDLTVKRVW